MSTFSLRFEAETKSVIFSPNNGDSSTVIVRNGWADTLTLANFFGKQHSHVLRDVRRCPYFGLSTFGLPKIMEAERTVPAGGRGQGRTTEVTYYHIDRDVFAFIAMTYQERGGNGVNDLKMAYIDAFNVYEQAVLDIRNSETLEAAKSISESALARVAGKEARKGFTSKVMATHGHTLSYGGITTDLTLAALGKTPNQIKSERPQYGKRGGLLRGVSSRDVMTKEELNSVAFMEMTCTELMNSEDSFVKTLRTAIEVKAFMDSLKVR